MLSYKGPFLTLGKTGQFYAEIVVVRDSIQFKKTHKYDWPPCLNFLLQIAIVLPGLNAVTNVPSHNPLFLHP